MTLVELFVFILIAILAGFIPQGKARTHLLLGISALAVFALQPSLPIRGLDFWLPFLTLVLVLAGWLLTTDEEHRSWRRNGSAVILLGGIVLALGAARYLDVSIPLTASRPPSILFIGTAIGLTAAALGILGCFRQPNRALLLSASLLILGLFFVIKVPAVSSWVARGLRNINGQPTALVSSADISWLGYSYIAFRLLHTLRDKMTGRLPAVDLPEYVVYMLFFPTLVAGPIDRLERFIKDLRSPSRLTISGWTQAGTRITVGLFKKFALADSLALIALNPTNALQIRSGLWGWILLYAYTLRIYFDFSGYTDIAIGLGQIIGINLPENFHSPYIQTNVTQFWNSWHISLTQWFRSYFFNPLTRALRSLKRPLPVSVIILVSQVTTMLLIAFWHGVSENFVLWGLWHGIGLFIHNRWSDWMKTRSAGISEVGRKALHLGGILLTFHFVALGWVFFAISLPAVSVQFLLRLFGLA